MGVDGLDEGGGAGILMFNKINRNMLMLEWVFLCVLNKCFLPVGKAIDLGVFCCALQAIIFYIACNIFDTACDV